MLTLNLRLAQNYHKTSRSTFPLQDVFMRDISLTRNPHEKNPSRYSQDLAFTTSSQQLFSQVVKTVEIKNFRQIYAAREKWNPFSNILVSRKRKKGHKISN